MARVLCLTSWFPPHHAGGYELSCHDVMAGLAERGHHVEVLTSTHRNAGVADPAQDPVVAVHRDLQLYFRDGDLWIPSMRRRLQVERANQQALRAALESCRPDVVAVWHVGAMSLGLLSTIATQGIPMVHAISDDWPIYAPRLDQWLRPLRRVPGLGPAVELPTGVPARLPRLDDGAACYISEVTRARCERRSPFSFAHSTVVYSGIDGALFSGVGTTPYPTWRSRLLYVGRIDPRKGIETLVRALALLPDATLVVDGHASGTERAQLDAWTSQVGVTDRVTVQTSAREDLPRVYAEADACVFASEWAEPFGLVPLEAMACGTPVAATGVGGSGEFLWDGGNCVRFEAGDPEALAAAVRRLAEHPALRAHLASQGLRTADFFDVSRLTDTFEAWYEAAASGYRDGVPADRRPPTPTTRWVGAT